MNDEELENFKKLNQIDRIEYLLRLERGEKILEDKTWDIYSLFLQGVIGIGFILLLSLQVLDLGYIELFNRLINIISPLFQVYLILSIVGLMWNMICYSRFFKNKKSFNEEFFKTEVKPKKK